MSKLIKIESISKAKRKDYFKVETSIGPFQISEGMIVKYMILKDREFTDEEFTSIMNDITQEKFLSSALNYISYQMRSEKEIRDYLLEKELNGELLEKIVGKLKDLNYINDDELAKVLLRESINKGKGPNALKNKYLVKGIDRDIFTKYLVEYSEEVEYDNAFSLASKLVNKYLNYPINKQKQKIYEKLVRDGFNQSVCNRVINSLEFIDESEESLKKDIRLLYLKYNGFDNESKKKVISKLLLKGYEYKNIKKYLEEVSEELKNQE